MIGILLIRGVSCDRCPNEARIRYSATLKLCPSCDVEHGRKDAA